MCCAASTLNVAILKEEKYQCVGSYK